MAASRILLGPQRPIGNLAQAFAAAESGGGPAAIVAAGWQESEEFVDDVRELAGRELKNLNLYQRAEAIMAADPALHATYRERQERLKELQRLYRLRLRQLMIAARQVYRSDADADLLHPERRHAIAQLRALDRHHAHRVAAIQSQYREATSETASAVLATHRRDVLDVLEQCETVVITGGNVVVLLNRLELFGLCEALAEKTIVAWSAGAMVLGEQIVLYHDRTPHGRRDPEVLGKGLGLLPAYVFLPDTRSRLKTRDASRIVLFSRRFAPAACLTLNSGALLQFDGQALRAAEQCKRFTADGEVVAVRAA